MSQDAREKASAEATLRCRACDADLTRDGHWQDANGYRYCDQCIAHLRTQPPHQAPLFKCDACNRAWPLKALTERKSHLICKECIANPDGPAVANNADSGVAAAPAGANGAAVAKSRPKRKSRVEIAPIPSQLLRPLPNGIVASVVCPHCWNVFPPDRTLWVSQHAELMGDPVLGPEAPARFRPTRFNARGEALDLRDTPCQVLACPQCHLVVPPALIETPPLFMSIIGAPASGKSHFLASMVWELRRIMAAQFNIVFNDADPAFNQSLNRYEETLFLQDRTDRPVAIRKTEMQGELYTEVRFGKQIVSLPRPFLFTLRPMPAGNQPPSWTVRMMCFYDNAGEHYQPGMDTVSAPGTQHLAKSRVLFFLYDPSQHPRFREACRTVSSDPQLHAAARSYRQEQILTEAATRVRRYTHLSADKKHDKPLMVLVSKADIWSKLLGEDLTREPFGADAPDSKRLAVDLPRIERVSIALRRLLLKHAPELVAAAEDFCQRVIYIPVSSLGAAPEMDAKGGMLAIRPDKIKPRWVTAPILYLLGKWSKGLIPTIAAAPVLAPAQGVAPASTAAPRVNGASFKTPTAAKIPAAAHAQSVSGSPKPINGAAVKTGQTKVQAPVAVAGAASAKPQAAGVQQDKTSPPTRRSNVA